MSEAKGPGANIPWQTATHCNKDLAVIFTSWGRRRLPFIGGTDIRLAYQLPRKPAAGAHPSG